jgi:hypothetical protein
LLNWKQEMINSFIIHPTTGTPMNNASTEGVNVNLKMYKYGEMKLYNYGGLVLSSVLIITAIY